MVQEELLLQQLNVTILQNEIQCFEVLQQPGDFSPPMVISNSLLI